jgi:hypothetical protein
VDIVVVGPGNAIWHKAWSGSSSGWENLGGDVTADPAISSWAPGRLDIFVRGGDNALWHVS